jgi:hypothetical protein
MNDVARPPRRGALLDDHEPIARFGEANRRAQSREFPRR